MAVGDKEEKAVEIFLVILQVRASTPRIQTFESVDKSIVSVVLYVPGSTQIVLSVVPTSSKLMELSAPCIEV